MLDWITAVLAAIIAVAALEYPIHGGGEEVDEDGKKAADDEDRQHRQ
ncbi:hypothetical protein [Cupriavidus neocaledonicus]|nr:hypothetical protein [Cupriavidus neocaledonicus]